jgi:acetyl esterase/lipase|tara:strand:+ start:1062 stop:1784 length:723 start_codon:yes stop_codon:yes gene_type:complete
MSPEDRSVLDLVSREGDRFESYGAHPDQVVEIFSAVGEMLGQVVLIHGGYWRFEYDRVHLRSYAAALADLGWNTVLIEYRRTPGSPDNYLEDVRAAIVHCGGGTLIGHSAGGHLALLAANEITSPFIKSVIALAPVGDLAEADKQNLDDGAVKEFLGTSALNRPDMDPNLMLNRNTPVLIIHGSDDIRVPIALSRTLHGSYIRAGLDSELVELENIGHFELIDYRVQQIELVLAHLRMHA